MQNVYDEFEWRGMLYDATPGLKETLAEQKIKAYIGFDPTASSLHVGSLMPIMGLVHLQRAGHVPIPLVGGGTGMIGDPSGKTAERQLLTKEKIQENLEGIKAQLSRFLDFDAKNAAVMMNNADWLLNISAIDFLRDVGKYFTVNAMMAKESVRRRIESEDGISFTEFSYSLLQSYDYLTLYNQHGVTLQMGGSDQWGNITAGADLIRRVTGGKAHALVFPLVTTSSGVKFGKTEAGTIWLAADRTSPFRFYQFWLNTDDLDLIRYLKFFTLMSQEEIQALTEELAAFPEKRAPHRALAREITGRVHGETALAKAEQATQALFGGEIKDLSKAELLDIFAEVPSITLPKASFEGEGMSLTDLVAACGYAPSRGQARKLLEGGGVYVHNVQVTDSNTRIDLNRAVEGQILILRKGKKEYRLVQIQ